MNKKTILILPENQKLHTLYEPLVSLLSKKYNLILSSNKNKNILLDHFKNIYFLRYFYHKFIRKFVSLNDLRSNNFKSKINSDLILSMNEIPLTNKNYILHLETVSGLAGYNYDKIDIKKIKCSLEKDNCKAIICWNKACYRSLISTIDCSSFKDKIKIIPFSIKSKKVKKTFNKKVNLLFVSSVNNPDDFELKGGLIALKSYELLCKKYENITFTIRANVSDKLIKKYSYLKGINFVNKYLNDFEMENLFLNSDILLEPLPGINLGLECLNYAIPMICLDYLWIPEMVVNNHNGFVIPANWLFGNKKNISDYLKNMHLNYLKLYQDSIGEHFALTFAKKTSELIENISLRRRFSREAKKSISYNGKYSFRKISSAFEKIIQEAMQ